MGQFFKIKCPKCGDEKFYELGRGFIPIEDGAYDEIQNAPEYSLLKTQVNSPEDLYDSCYKVYFCKDCKTLENHISFKLKNITSFRHKRKCSKCGKVMKGMLDVEDIVTRKITINCGICGTEDIAGSNLEVGFWD